MPETNITSILPNNTLSNNSLSDPHAQSQNISLSSSPTDNINDKQINSKNNQPTDEVWKNSQKEVKIIKKHESNKKDNTTENKGQQIDEEGNTFMKEINEYSNFKKNKPTQVLVQEFDDDELSKNPEYLYEKLESLKTKVIKAFSMEEKILIKFKNNNDLNTFIYGPYKSKIFGEKAKYTVLENKINEALIIGIDKRLNLKNSDNYIRFSNAFIEKQVMRNIENCVDVEIKEGKSVLIKFKNNKKMAKITLDQEIHLAEALSKNTVKIGFDEYRICMPVYKRTKVCKNCGRLGHSEYNCNNETRCTKCAGSHKQDDCNTKEEKCINCGGNHQTTSFKCKKTKIKRHNISREKKERMLRKWNIKNDNEVRRTPQRVVWELIEEEKKKLRKKLSKRLMTEYNKEGYSFVLNKYKNFIIKNDNNEIDYKETINNYLKDSSMFKSNDVDAEQGIINKQNNKGLIVASIKIRSIINKLGMIKEFLFNNNIDILCVQETWINPENTKYLNFRGYETIQTKPCKRKGCGILTLIKKNIKYSIIQVKELEDDLEIITIRIKNLNISNIYIHPNSKKQGFYKMKNTLRNMKDFHIITGDFNAHHKSWSRGKQNKRGELLAFWLKNNCMKVVNGKEDATHFNFKTKESNSPDICAINEKFLQNIDKIRIGEDLGSDHLPIIMEVNIKMKKRKTKYRKRWLYEKCSKKNFEATLKSHVKEMSDYNEFADNLLKIANKTCKKNENKRRLQRESMVERTMWNRSKKENQIKKENATK